MPRPPNGMSKRAISERLEALAEQVVDMDEGGEPLTRADKLARMLWDRALGYKEEKMGDDGVTHIREHRPENWAIATVIDRIEGKTITRTIEAEDRSVSPAKKINDIAKSKINKASAGGD